MSLILVRHGQTEMNRGGRFQGRADSRLTELGEAQADMVAATLADSGATAVVSSPLLRATQTAERIAAALGVVVQIDERLIEIDYGTWDREPLSTVSADEWARWRADPEFTPPGGESLLTVWDRAVACADDLLVPRRTTVAVSHVSPIKAVVAWSLGAGLEATWRMHLDVAAICAVDRRGADPLLLWFNRKPGAR
ncbi:MAG TPA: histidine phosphatase family protein [Acidimicrobiia bacterium]